MTWDTGTISFEGLRVVGETALLSAGFAPRSVLKDPCGCNLLFFNLLVYLTVPGASCGI